MALQVQFIYMSAVGYCLYVFFTLHHDPTAKLPFEKTLVGGIVAFSPGPVLDERSRCTAERPIADLSATGFSLIVPDIPEDGDVSATERLLCLRHSDDLSDQETR